MFDYVMKVIDELLAKFSSNPKEFTNTISIVLKRYDILNQIVNINREATYKTAELREQLEELQQQCNHPLVEEIEDYDQSVSICKVCGFYL